MTVAPNLNNQGSAELGISTAGVSTTRQVAKMRNAANTADVDYAAGADSIHIESSSFKVRITVTDTIAHQAAQWIIAVVPDAFDPGGNYTAADGTTLSANVLAVRELGDLPAGTTDIVIGDGSGTNGATLNTSLSGKGFGTFRIVLAAGNNVLNAKRVSSATAAGAFHEDSDGNTASGTGDLVAVNGNRVVGTGGIKCKLTAASRTAGNWGYPDQITASFTLKGAIDGTSNPFNLTGAALKDMKVAWSTASGGTPTVKKQGITISSTGVVSVPATNIDTLWGSAIAGTDYYTQIAVGQNLGDATTPAGEKAAIYAIGTTDAPDSEQVAYVFQTTTQSGAFVNSSDASRRIRTSTADQKASAAIQSTITTYSSSGRTTPQNHFKRRGTVNTTNAIVFYRGVFTDAYGVVLPNATTLILSTRTATGAGDVQEDTQTLDCGGGTGTIDWQYTIAATHAAYSTMVKPGVTRVTGSHVATGPDSSAPATFSLRPTATYAAPWPGYPKDVRTTGNEFAGVNEPQVRQTSIFGVNCDIIFEDIWTGSLINSQLDANGVPNGPGGRSFVIPNSAKCKTSTLIDEGTVRIIDVTEFNPKDITGTPIDLSGAELLEGRRALWDVGQAAVSDAGTNLGNPNRLDAPLGYATGSSSLDSIAAPTDPSSFAYYQFFKDTAQGNEATEDASGFLLTVDITNVGHQTDAGNFGYIRQGVSWINPDFSIFLALTPKVSQSDPGITQRLGVKVFRTTPDAFVNPIQASFAPVHPDEAPVWVAWGLNTDGSQTFLASGSATAIGTPSTTADFFIDITVPSGYDAIKIQAFARVSGSPVAGGGEAQIQVDYDYDATGSFIRILQSR